MKILRMAMSSFLKIQMFFVLLELVISEENIDAPETWIMRSKFNFVTVIILKALLVTQCEPILKTCDRLL